MPPPPLPHHIVERVVEIVEAHREPNVPLWSIGGGTPSIVSRSWRTAVEQGVARDRNQWTRLVRRVVRSGHLMDDAAEPAPPGYEIAERTVSVDAQGRTRRSVRQRPERGAAFRVPAGHYVKGRSALVGPDGRVAQEWIKTDVERAERWRAMERGIREAFSGFRGAAPDVEPPTQSDADLLQLYVVADLHFGMYAWGQEAGGNYDIDVASRAVRTGIASLTHRAPPADTGCLLIIGDYYHANDAKSRTPTSNHVLDVDTRFARVAREGAWLARDAVELLRRRHRHVIVRIIPGNHDPEAAGHLAVALEMYYHGQSNVEVVADPSLWWWHSWGDVLLGAHHGHGLRPEEIPAIASDAARSLRLTPAHIHVHLGHRHKKAGDERYGVTWEVHRSIATSDAYHAGLWLRGPSTMDAITYHKTMGERGRATERVLEPAMIGAAA